tara:strand:+ start:4915 stop:5112 length:198 start_codon:yes stop_codon:yes gene_type:complete
MLSDESELLLSKKRPTKIKRTRPIIIGILLFLLDIINRKRTQLLFISLKIDKLVKQWIIVVIYTL